ncbi:MAG: DUF488 domain-containing protein [Caulobacterales bacterium]
MRLYTIGYQERSLRDVIAALQAAGVRRVIDVRDLPNSRRPGFSKRQLQAGLEEAGIDYFHLKALGTPKEGRLAARAKRHDQFWSIVDNVMAQPPAQLAVQEAAALASEKPSALLCYEADHAECHRLRIAEALTQNFGFKVNHLSVPHLL